MSTQPIEIIERLEYLRGEIRAERISYGELHELQGLGIDGQIHPDDLELLEWAGVDEHHEPVPEVVAESEGRAAFARGDRRVCPIAPDPGRAVGADDGWAERAQAWYRGWDAANLAAPIPERPTPSLDELERRGETGPALGLVPAHPEAPPLTRRIRDHLAAFAPLDVHPVRVRVTIYSPAGNVVAPAGYVSWANYTPEHAALWCADVHYAGCGSAQVYRHELERLD